MTDERVAGFLAGDRPDDVALYLSAERVSNVESLLEKPVASAADDGVLLVVDGETGRSVFRQFTGQDAMDFTGAAMQRDGHVEQSLAAGTCPDDDGDEPHEPVFVFSFAEEQNEEVGGMYARGAVVHAYAQCSCGTAYADKWVVDER
mgnify:CR=1 FL=1